MGKKKKKGSPIVIRIPVPKSGSDHGDKSKYNRKRKHKKMEEV